MRKFILLPLFLFALVLILNVSPAKAQGVDPTALLNEPPLTAADFPVYKAFTKASIEAASDPSKAATIYQTAATAAGVTETRVAYVSTKISVIIGILGAPDSKDAILATLTGNLKPTEDEIKLVSDNLTELQSN
ncbi:MAG: hypothetical protein LBF22_02190 [Deltaproteobacteria bacterium]|nr:hypothetical protein [Deltaproteobacteria bacterium]